MAKFGFNTDDYENQQPTDYSPMPKGEYSLKATDAELKDSAKGGTYLAVTFEVAKGEHTGRKIWQNFNITCSSDKGEKIGREQVAGWAKACGKPNAKDSDELLERPFQCKLDIEKGTGGYSDKNKIASFLFPEKGGVVPKSEKPAPTPPVEEKEPPAKKEPASESPSSENKNRKNPWD